MKNFLATKGIKPEGLHTVKPSNKNGLNHPNPTQEKLWINPLKSSKPHTGKQWINPHTLREVVAYRKYPTLV